jgi:tetratricopeptide (TPR) repeat protein
MFPRILLLSLISAGIAMAQSTQPAVPEKFRELIMEVQQLQSQKQYTDALEKLHQAEAILPNSPVIDNARGSIYTAMRDFDKAQEYFNKVKVQNPDSFEPKFNLTELDYVRGKYAEAEAGFSDLLKQHPKIRQEVRHLVQFKVLVCQLKQDKINEAEATMKAFTFMDDTPAYYFAKASFAFQKNLKQEAQDWLSKAGAIFKLPDNAAYLDSLMEAHWIESIEVPAADNKTAKP